MGNGIRQTTHCFSPIVGMVVTTSPSFNLYRVVVLPAASKPTEQWRKKREETKD